MIWAWPQTKQVYADKLARKYTGPQTNDIMSEIPQEDPAEESGGRPDSGLV